MRWELRINKVLGIIGIGRIGKIVAKRVRGFDMTIIANDIVEYREFIGRYGSSR
jgi:phosphoglycerate dehydrogenase-like enzyme